MNQFIRRSLAFVAGYCDTVTFIHMGGVFCAHVTGNFVLFGASVARGIESEDYLKIVTFPVFVIGVVLATLLIHRLQRTQTEGWLRSTFWCITLLHSLALICAFAEDPTLDVVATMLLVVALSFQNTIHHFTPGPMTTVMTGTVMNTTAKFTKTYLLSERSHKEESDSGPGPGLGMMVAFLGGCTLGSLGAFEYGLKSLAVSTLVVFLVVVVGCRFHEKVRKSSS